MVKQFLALVIGSLLFASCSLNSGTVFYPKLHLVALYGKVTPSLSDADYLNWGDKLVYLNQVYTNTNRAGQFSYFYYVKNAIDNKTGYVDRDNVVMDPVSRAIVLASAIAYETPTMISRNKQNVQNPLLAYVTEIKDGEWAKIEPYNVPSKYTLTNDSSAITWVTYQWVSVKEIDTNRSDVDIFITLQLAVRKYNESKKIYDSTPDAKNLKTFQDTIRPEVENLKKLMEMYPQVNPAVDGAVRAFLNIAAPDVPEGGTSSSESGTNGSTPPTQEEL